MNSARIAVWLDALWSIGLCGYMVAFGLPAVLVPEFGQGTEAHTSASEQPGWMCGYMITLIAAEGWLPFAASSINPLLLVGLFFPSPPSGSAAMAAVGCGPDTYGASLCVGFHAHGWDETLDRPLRLGECDCRNDTVRDRCQFQAASGLTASRDRVICICITDRQYLRRPAITSGRGPMRGGIRVTVMALIPFNWVLLPVADPTGLIAGHFAWIAGMILMVGA